MINGILMVFRIHIHKSWARAPETSVACSRWLLVPTIFTAMPKDLPDVQRLRAAWLPLPKLCLVFVGEIGGPVKKMCFCSSNHRSFLGVFVERSPSSNVIGGGLGPHAIKRQKKKQHQQQQQQHQHQHHNNDDDDHDDHSATTTTTTATATATATATTATATTATATATATTKTLRGTRGQTILQHCQLMPQLLLTLYNLPVCSWVDWWNACCRWHEPPVHICNTE